MADLDRIVIHIDASKFWRRCHTRDSGKPVLLNVLTATCIKAANTAMEPNGGTAVWVQGRQDPFYIRETVDDLRLDEDSAGVSDKA